MHKLRRIRRLAGQHVGQLGRMDAAQHQQAVHPGCIGAANVVQQRVPHMQSFLPTHSEELQAGVKVLAMRLAKVLHFPLELFVPFGNGASLIEVLAIRRECVEIWVAAQQRQAARCCPRQQVFVGRGAASVHAVGLRGRCGGRARDNGGGTVGKNSVCLVYAAQAYDIILLQLAKEPAAVLCVRRIAFTLLIGMLGQPHQPHGPAQCPGLALDGCVADFPAGDTTVEQPCVKSHLCQVLKCVCRAAGGVAQHGELFPFFVHKIVQHRNDLFIARPGSVVQNAPLVQNQGTVLVKQGRVHGVRNSGAASCTSGFVGTVSRCRREPSLSSSKVGTFAWSSRCQRPWATRWAW
eukprot:m.202149 g.202149  ORF g.202149 m.202149 type:complete len:350 (-) comp21951_c0_seq1:725-1774(-)